MNSNEMMFFPLLGLGLGKSVSYTYASEIVDKKFYDFSEKHQCVPFMYQACSALGIDTPQIWKQRTIYSAINNTQKLVVQSKICKRLSDAGILHAVFKGSAVAVHYPFPDLRSLGDIDILVDEKNYEKAIELFVGEIDEKDAWHNFHFTFTMDSVEIEIHKYVTHIPKTKEEQKIYDMMSDCLNEVVYLEYDRYRFPALINKYHAMALLLHKKRHFMKNNITLRMVCDWAFFVESVDSGEWDTEVYPFIKECGLDAFADAFTLLADKYLGFNNKSKVCSDISDKIIDNLTEILIRCSSDGEEADISSGVGTIYSNHIKSHGRVWGIIKAYNCIIRTRHPLAKYKLILPLFWLYVPVMYIGKMIIGKRKPIDFSAANSLAQKRAKVYDELRIK